MKIMSIDEINTCFRELLEQLKLVELTLDKHKANKKPLSIILNKASKLKVYSRDATLKLNTIKRQFDET